MTIDVWMQHPTLRFLDHEMFDSLRRWTGQEAPTEELPIALTVAAMEEAGVSFGLLSAWRSPQASLISNDEVAGWTAEHPGRFAGLAAVDLAKPMAAVRELRRCVSELAFVGLRGNRAIAASQSAANKANWAQSASDARTATRWAPWSSSGWQLLGEAQFHQRKLGAARRSFHKALAKDPADWSIWLDLAVTSRGAERRRAFAEATRLNPFSPEIAAYKPAGRKR